MSPRATITSTLGAVKEAANEAQKSMLANEREQDEERRRANEKRIDMALDEATRHLVEAKRLRAAQKAGR